MKIELKDGKTIELTEEVIQKVADLIVESGDLEKPDYPYVGMSQSGDIRMMTQSNFGMNMVCDEGGYKMGQFTDVYSGTHTPFTGTITYKNGKPVKTRVEK